MFKRSIKAALKNIFNFWFKIFLGTKIGSFYKEYFIYYILNKQKKIEHNGTRMTFCVPNKLNLYRADSFSNKEPDTLSWIDLIPEGSLIWDIGANVGLYSVYAAKTRNCKVYAFEPSVFNLELLARNIFLNKLQDNITIIPISLSEKLTENRFQMTSVDWGGALSTFGAGIDQFGNHIKEIFEYKTIGISMDEAIRYLNLEYPKYLKIDVDGIEHFILKGGTNVLENVDSVLIEINEEYNEQVNECVKYLNEAGLSLYKKCYIDSNSQFNQWWVRESTPKIKLNG